MKGGDPQGGDRGLKKRSSTNRADAVHAFKLPIQNAKKLIIFLCTILCRLRREKWTECINYALKLA